MARLNFAALIPRVGMPIAAISKARQAYEVEGGLALNEYLRAGVDLNTAIVNARVSRIQLDRRAIRAIVLCVGGVGVFVAREFFLF